VIVDLTYPPPTDSLFWKLWNSCEDIAQKALNTKFLQGIKNGNLDPTKYGAFNVSDAYYCFNGAVDYLIAGNKAKDEELKAFLYKKCESFINFNNSLGETWRLKDCSSVVPTESIKNYSDFKRSVAINEDSIYSLIAMLPCK